MLTDEIWCRLEALERSDRARRLADIGRDEQIAALVRASRLQRAQRTIEQSHPRTVRAARVYALIWEVARAYGPISTNTARAIRDMVSGVEDPPPGLASAVDMIRDHYERTPCWETFWIAMKERRELEPLK